MSEIRRMPVVGHSRRFWHMCSMSAVRPISDCNTAVAREGTKQGSGHAAAGLKLPGDLGQHADHGLAGHRHLEAI